MRDIKKLNPNKITDDGRYFDMGASAIFTLSDEEIREARRYFNDKTIAQDRKIEVKKINNLNNNSRKKFVLDKGGYSKQKVKQKKRVNNKSSIPLVIGSVVVLLCIESFIVYKNLDTIPAPEGQVVVDTPIEITVPLPSGTESNEDDFDYIKKESYRLIEKYCKVYSVNYGMVCNVLERLTNNFTDSSYTDNLCIKGIRCKGEQVMASSLEQLILCAVRHIKQIPSDFGLNSDNLNVYNSYDSSNNYIEKIDYYSKLLDVDRCLVYAIVREETGFNSPLFQENNNPAGLRLNGEWWSFSTKDEGFIELCLEIKKYEMRGAKNIAQIGAIHAPVSDGNYNWVPNVTEIYEWALENVDNLFGSEDINKNLKF